MAAPSYKTAAAVGITDATGAWSFNFAPTSAVAAGDLIIVQILQDGTTAGAVALTSSSNDEALDGTDASLTYIGAFAVGSPTVAYQHLWIGRALNASSGSVSGTNSTSEDLYGRAYWFTNVSTGTTLATVIENALNYPYSAGEFEVGNTGSEQTAESFTFSAAATIQSVKVWLRKLNSPTDNLVVEIQSDSGGSPSGSVVATIATVAGTGLTASLTAYTYACSVSLSAATPYWLVFHRSGSIEATNRYGVGSSVDNSLTRKYYTAGAWNAGANDLAFVLSEIGSATSEGGTAATVSDTGVTTLGPDRLALQFVGINDDNAQVAFTGETGGNWSEAVDEYAEAAGTDGSIGLQTAAMASAGTVDGGTFTQADGTDGWGVVGFALIGTTVPDTYQPRHPAINFQDPAVLMRRLHDRIYVPRLWLPEEVTI